MKHSDTQQRTRARQRPHAQALKRLQTGDRFRVAGERTILVLRLIKTAAEKRIYVEAHEEASGASRTILIAGRSLHWYGLVVRPRKITWFQPKRSTTT